MGMMNKFTLRLILSGIEKYTKCRQTDKSMYCMCTTRCTVCTVQYAQCIQYGQYSQCVQYVPSTYLHNSILHPVHRKQVVSGHWFGHHSDQDESPGQTPAAILKGVSFRVYLVASSMHN